MKSYIFLSVIIAISLFACGPEPITDHYYNIKNNSNYNIDIFGYFNGHIYDSLSIPVAQSKVFVFSEEGESGPSDPPFGDSAIVVFDDTLSIIHGSKLYDVNRDIRRYESYCGGEKTEGSKRYFFEVNYEYIFTNNDYLEALEKQ